MIGLPPGPTKYPFVLPARLITRLPRPSRDGNVYADVRLRGRWDGILVIDQTRRCVGVYEGRAIVQAPLPFAPDEMEDLRPPSLPHRLLAQIPASIGPHAAGALTVLVLAPASVVAGALLSGPLALLAPPLALVGTWLMYQARGFPLLRLPLALTGVVCSILGVLTFLRGR